MLPINAKTAAASFKEALKLISARRYDAAHSLLTGLLRSLPDRAEVPFQLARVASARGAPAEAAEWLARAEKMKPTEPAILKARLEAEQAAGLTKAALATFDRLARLRPGAIAPLADKAVYLQQIGAFDEATTLLRRLLKRAPLEGELFRILVASRKVRPGDPILQQMIKAHGDNRIKGLARAHLDFALAKAFEDTGAYDRVMGHLKAGNAAMRAAHPYHIGSRRTEVDRILGVFRGQKFRPAPDEDGDGSFLPIFLTGMPRSGTTLMEQILASHSEVTGGDELGFATVMADNMLSIPGRAVAFDQITPAQFRTFAQALQERTRSAVPFDRIVTDKSVQSYLVTGFLSHALPGARVLIVDRDPRDMLLSIFKNVFVAGKHLYAYDLEDLARYYVMFREVLAFWQDTAPDTFTTFSYDRLVADPEPQIRALVDAAGLDWQESCLNFHQTERRVQTVSLHQVRQPIYRSSVAAWQRYEKELEPMLDILDKAGVLPA